MRARVSATGAALWIILKPDLSSWYPNRLLAVRAGNLTASEFLINGNRLAALLAIERNIIHNYRIRLRS